MNAQQTAEKIREWAAHHSMFASWKVAGTGTVYVTLDTPEETLVVRIGNHGACYGGYAYSIDPSGQTYGHVMRSLSRRTGFAWPVRTVKIKETTLVKRGLCTTCYACGRGKVQAVKALGRSTALCARCWG